MPTYICTWTVAAENRLSTWNLFGNMTPEDDVKDVGNNVKMIARYHNLNGYSGTLIAETDDINALNRWLMNWGSVCEITCVPVITDTELRSNLQDKPFFQKKNCIHSHT